ncbi:MAG: hypothetical protein ACLUQ6_00630 [Alistipes onderdonkii]
MGRYFYVEIVAKGIMLYDSGECLLTTPKELDYAEIKAMAERVLSQANIFALHISLMTLLLTSTKTDLSKHLFIFTKLPSIF